VKHSILFVVNVDWFFLSHRLPIALAAQEAGYVVHVASGLTDKLPQLLQHGFMVHPLTLSRSQTGLLGNFRIFFSLFTVLRRVRPDLVHLVTIKPVLLGGLAARLVGAPAVVAAVSGLGFVFVAKGWVADLRRGLVAVLYRFALGHANSKVIFQNADDQVLVSQMANLPPERVARIRGSGVDLSAHVLQPWPEGPPVVMLASRLLADKGVREFVEAAAALRHHPGGVGQGVRFVLVGQPDLDNPASLQQDELDAWHAAGLVELWGHRLDMHAVLSLASVVVLPSYREGLPKVLIEAAACGRAVVTTDVPGCRDAIVPGVTGLLVPAKDAVALASAIAELLVDKQRCEAMGAAGRKLAEQAFDVNSVTEQHLSIYNELLSRVRA
jgi:glycosyltransferase involved in cell wall biosynthesis